MTVSQPSRRSLFAVAIALSLALSAHAQLPSVTGTVFHDSNSDGSLTSGEELLGVSVDLFKDDGDGLFSPTADSLVTSEITDINGMYLFGGLGMSDNYFVHQAAQMVGGMSIDGSVSGLLTAGAFNTMIDDFANQQQVEGNPIIPVGSTNLTSNSVIGGQRDLHVQYWLGPAEANLYANPYGLNQVLEFNQSAGVIATATVTWDGVDGDRSTTPAAGGLGGIDLTAGGLNEAFAFNLGIDAAGAGENLVLRIFSGSDVSEATVVIPVNDGTAVIDHIVPFSDFAGGADLTAVDAIQLELGGTKTSIDAQIGPIGLIGSAVENISVAVVPEPSTVLMGLFAITWFVGKNRRRRRR